MKSIIALGVLLATSICAEPAFVGYMTVQNQGTSYSIVPSAGATARWVKIGGTVEGYTVMEYQPTNEVLVLKKDDQTLKLKLKSSKVVANSSAKAEHVNPEFVSAARKKLLDVQDRLTRLREERERMLAERKAKEKSSTDSGKK